MTGEQKPGGLSAPTDLAGLCERLREQAAYDRQHYPPAHPLFTEAAAAIESLVAENERMRKQLAIWVPSIAHQPSISSAKGASDDR